MNKRNLANGLLATAINTSATSAVLQSGHGSRMPSASFYVTVSPPGEMTTLSNSEIWLVTAISTDTLTIIRAQKGTTAKSFDEDAVVVNGVYVEDVDPIAVTVATAATTAAKVGTTAAGNYSPVQGDRLLVTFNSGSNQTNPTLNIDGSGAKNIRLGNVNVTTATLGTTSSITLPMWYDGTGYAIYGSMKNDNTTYSEITDVEAANNSSTTTRLITGRRLQKAITDAFAAVTGFIRSTTTARLTVSATEPVAPSNGDIWYDTDDTSASLLIYQLMSKTYPIGSIYYNGTDSTNPGVLLGMGVWTPYLEGRVAVGISSSGTFSTIGNEIGAETHTLTIAEMPAHNHGTGRGLSAGTGTARYAMTSAATDGHLNSTDTGGGGAHNNIQPSKVVYAWIRTA